MPALLNNVVITTAVAAALGPTLQIRSPIGLPTSVGIQGSLSYGSGGTTINVWVQTSFDGGGTWCDVANFSFTTLSARSFFNVSSLTPKTTAVTPTDGALAANTCNDGMVGSQWRCKYTTTGTYAGNTQLSVDIEATGMTT
jgi:hypothetical protein